MNALAVTAKINKRMLIEYCRFHQNAVVVCANVAIDSINMLEIGI